MDEIKLGTLEEFYQKFGKNVEYFNYESELLNLPEERKQQFDQALTILTDKLDAIQKAKNKKELKKHIRLKTLFKDEGVLDDE